MKAQLQAKYMHVKTTRYKGKSTTNIQYQKQFTSFRASVNDGRSSNSGNGRILTGAINLVSTNANLALVYCPTEVLCIHFDYAVNDSEDLVQVSSYASPRTVDHFGDLRRSCSQMSVVQVVVTIFLPPYSTSGNVPEPWTAVKDGSNTFLYDSSLLRCRYRNPRGKLE